MLTLGVSGLGVSSFADEPLSAPPTMAEVIERSTPADWRVLDPDNTLYMELPAGRVVIELAPGFAPLHARNIRMLVRTGYFDGLAIMRSQDNYVAQWGDPDSDDPRKARSLGEARDSLPAEFTVPVSTGTPFTRLPDADGYAPQVGFANGFPAARDPVSGRTWLCHCYGAVGVARGNESDSGSGAQLYAVTGHAPRHLDRNITLVGRVMQGMELLTTLPRGTGALGFYETAAERLPIKSIRLATDVPEAERAGLEIMRTDTQAFSQLVEARRNRREEWFKAPAGYIELCNVPIVVRRRK
jgi:peptidylprolyl isomerase